MIDLRWFSQEFSRCNHCLKDIEDDYTYELRVMPNTYGGGVVMRLCKDCVNDLKDVLNKRSDLDED